MIAAICSEIILRKPYLNVDSSNPTIETIYFGGGTPSLLNKKEILTILNLIKENFEIIPNPEITLEANPDDLSIEKLKDFKAVGINRLSIGLQSFREEDLKWMNRAHTAEESFNCIQLAQQIGYDNISIDLIYGLPNLSLAEWEQTVQTAIDLNVQHISAYCLTVEGKTALKKWVDQSKISVANEEQQSEQFELLIEKLEKAQIFQYEISNFSKINLESKHNSSYWKGTYYLGVGPSAHSYNGNTRSWNIANNINYIKAIQNQSVWFETETLSAKDKFNEYLLTGLRMKIGVDLSKLFKIIQAPKSFSEKLNEFINTAWIVQKKEQITLTKEGKLRADYIASELFL